MHQHWIKEHILNNLDTSFPVVATAAWGCFSILNNLCISHFYSFSKTIRTQSKTSKTKSNYMYHVRIDSSMILSEQVESSKHGGKCLTCGNWPGAKLSMAGAGAARVAQPALRSGASTACLVSGAQTEGSIGACLHEEGKQHQRVEGKKSKMRVPWGAEQSRSTIN